MDIERVAGNCIAITTKSCKLITDPKLSDLGLKDKGLNIDVQLLTREEFLAPASEGTLILSLPGEYEIQDVSIKGVAARAYGDAKGELMRSTLYRIEAGGVSAVVTGHIQPELSDEQLEDIGIVDVLIVPVGNSGYTLDSLVAIQIIRNVEPKIVVPVHYNEADVRYPVPQADLEVFVKELGAPLEQATKLKLKPGMISDTLTVYELKRAK